MRLVSYFHEGRIRPGAVDGEKIYDLSLLLKVDVPDLLWFIEQGQAAIEEAVAALSRAVVDPVGQMSEVRLSAPIPRPRKNVFCVGRNYAEHARERGSDLPPDPVFFTKAPNTVVGPNAPVLYHPITHQLDYEVELAVVIGSKGCNISREKALTHVYGYTIVNDITARDLQKKHQQWFKGKSLDTSCPMGPVLVTADEIPDPQNLAIRLWVNGEERQAASTSDMIFSIPALIEVLSQGYTLEVGDIIATGTPSGVGAGFNPPRFLQVGDKVEAEIASIGRLVNYVAATGA